MAIWIVKKSLIAVRNMKMMTVMEIKHLENKVFIIWGKGMKCTHEFQTRKIDSSIRTVPMASKVSKILKLRKYLNFSVYSQIYFCHQSF